MGHTSRHLHLICFDPAVEKYIVALIDYLSSFSWVPFLAEETWLVWLKGYYVFWVGRLFWFPFDTLCYLLFLCWKLPFNVAPESCPTLPYLLGLHNTLSKWQHVHGPLHQAEEHLIMQNQLELISFSSGPNDHIAKTNWHAEDLWLCVIPPADILSCHSKINDILGRLLLD